MRLDALLAPFLESPALLRLKGVDMSCGCHLSGLAAYNHYVGYSRWDHSLGVATILAAFTEEPAVIIAGLLHDIAAPAFSHTIDFLFGDHLHQEYTEGRTEEMIAADPVIPRALSKLGLSVEAVADYHRYSLADNDSPRLSADRLEYTLGTARVLYDKAAPADYGDYQPVLHDLEVAEAEDGAAELTFRHQETAEALALLSIQNGRLFASPGERYVMQYLSMILKDALSSRIIAEADLWQTEDTVLAKLRRHSEAASRLESLARIQRVQAGAAAVAAAEGGDLSTADFKHNDCEWKERQRIEELHQIDELQRIDELPTLVVPAKKRYIDPLWQGRRISRVSSRVAGEIEGFLAEDDLIHLTAFGE